MSPNEHLNSIILERTIQYITTQPQNSMAKESNATSELKSTWKESPKSRVHMFVTRVSSSSATLIDNIFINNPDQVGTCGNIHVVSHISDHFSQFCILKSVKNKAKVNKFKEQNFSQFSADRFNTELSQMDWNAIVETKLCDVNDLFSSFYNKFNKLVNKHAPKCMKTISNRKAKQFSKP